PAGGMRAPGMAFRAFALLACACSSAAQDPATTTAAARVHPDTACPPGTVAGGNGICSLDGDLQLTHTMRLGPSTRLNCKGHVLRPAVPGVDGVQAQWRPSSPEVAIFVEDAAGVVIQNCTIGAAANRFDFGVVIAGAAPSTNGQLRNQILANTMY